MPFTDLAAAQAAIDGWVSEYNGTPHQGIGMAAPAERFRAAAARAEEDLPPLRLPAVIALAPPPAPEPEPEPGPAVPAAWQGGPVEFDRVVPPSGTMEVRGKQFWLGTARSGMTVTVWTSTDVIHLTILGPQWAALVLCELQES